VRSVWQPFLRRCPVFPGKLRLAKFLLGELHGAAQVQDRFGFTYEVPDLREPIAFHLLVNGSYEPKIQKVIPALDVHHLGNR